MAANTNIFTEKETNNWFKAYIALNWTKEGLTDFVVTELLNVQKTVGSSCGQCFIQNLIPCPTQDVCKKRKRTNCSFHNSLQYKSCQTCDKVKQNITSLHRFNRPSWANTKAERWAMDPWEIGKCYLPRDGYISVSSVQASDFNGVISIMLNCTHFQTCVSTACLSPPPPDKQCPLEKVRQIGRDVRHTANCKVTDADLQYFFLILSTLLADPVCLVHVPSATEACRKLSDLQNERLSLDDLGKLLKEVNQTLTQAKEAEERFSEEVERKLKECLNAIEDKIQAGEQSIENKTQESINRIKNAAIGVTEVYATVIKGQQVIESATMEGRDYINSAIEAGVTEVNATVIKRQQVIESATMEGCDYINSAIEAGVTEVNAIVIKGQQFIESATMEGREDINSAIKAGVTEVNATVIKGQQVIESVTMEGRDEVTSAIEAGVTEVNATVVKAKRVVESAAMEGCDVVNSTALDFLKEISTQANTQLSEIQSKGDKVKAYLTGIKTQKEVEDFSLQCSDLVIKLIKHYRDTVICVPLSTLNPSLDVRVQDIYANPKIQRMKIEKDGKHVKQEQIYKYIDCFGGGFRRIYLQGEPGRGKSYFAAKLVDDWCNVYAPPIVKSTKEQMMFDDVDTLQKFRFLFFISLRDSRKQTHVTQMIKTQIIHKIFAANEWENKYELVLNIMKNIMFLIIQDGLDEWPGEEVLPSMDGIPKDHCIVLTTSRPWKLADERIRNSQIDILFDIEGISDPEEFNERILRCLLDDSADIKTSVELFEQFLRSRKLGSISSSPMLNTLVLSTWVDNRAERLTGSSLCELYTTLLENLCKKANSQISYFDPNHTSPVNCFSGTNYVKPNMEHIDSIAKAAFSFLFSNEKESSLVFSDIKLMAHLSPTAKQFALDSGLLSQRKGKKCTDQTLSFVHKTVQEFLAAFHIHRNADVIDDVISGYLLRNDKSYHDVSQIFIFLCGFNISAANKLSAMMNERDGTLINWLDVYIDVRYFQDCILSGYREAVANKNTPIHLHQSYFDFDSNNAKDLIQIWKLNTSRARSLTVSIMYGLKIHVTRRSQDASSADCHEPGQVALPAREDHGPSTLNDEDGVRSSTSCIEFDLSLCHNLELLELDDKCRIITVQPHALVGLKKLKYLRIYNCKYEALDLSHFEHIQSIDLHERVTLLPLSINNYKTLQDVTLFTTYDGLDLSLFENLKSISISNNVKVLPKPLLIHKKITKIECNDFDFNSLDDDAVYTWCLLNGADPVKCADYTPVLPSITCICFEFITCSSTWLCCLLSTLLTLDHKVDCSLAQCYITSFDPEVETSHTFANITTDLNNTCTLDFWYECPGLWETLHSLNVKHLKLNCKVNVFKLDHVSSLSQSLASLSQLETLTMHLSVYIDLQLPPSLKNLTVRYDALSPAELRHLVNKLSACTQSILCILVFSCGIEITEGTINNIPPEEYILIKQELEALECVEVKLFRIYDRTSSTSSWSDDAWSVRDSVVDDGDNSDDFSEDELFMYVGLIGVNDYLHRISMRLQINCFKEQALIK